MARTQRVLAARQPGHDAVSAGGEHQKVSTNRACRLYQAAARNALHHAQFHLARVRAHRRQRGLLKQRFGVGRDHPSRDHPGPGHGGPPRAPALSRSAARAATAMMVSAGLALPWVGSTLPSVM